MDVTSIFETSGDDQFSGFGAEFHFDTANQTLYFSADGTTASAIALAQVQAGVTLTRTICSSCEWATALAHGLAIAATLGSPLPVSGEVRRSRFNLDSCASAGRVDA